MKTERVRSWPGSTGMPASNGRVPNSTAMPLKRAGSLSARPPAKAAPPLKPTKMTGRPAGATSSSQERNQVNVWLNDVATGRPIPRFSNHA
jgi:hypothetical protein